MCERREGGGETEAWGGVCGFSSFLVSWARQRSAADGLGPISEQQLQQLLAESETGAETEAETEKDSRDSLQHSQNLSAQSIFHRSVLREIQSALRARSRDRDAVGHAEVDPPQPNASHVRGGG